MEISPNTTVILQRVLFNNTWVYGPLETGASVGESGHALHSASTQKLSISVKITRNKFKANKTSFFGRSSQSNSASEFLSD